METRAEAVAFLRAAGFPAAAERDWALGETIAIPAKPQPPGPDGVVVYDRIIYLVPNSTGWLVSELHVNPPRETLAPSLSEACQIAIDRLSVS